jgi:hypothetical protein
MTVVDFHNTHFADEQARSVYLKTQAPDSPLKKALGRTQRTTVANAQDILLSNGVYVRRLIQLQLRVDVASYRLKHGIDLSIWLGGLAQTTAAIQKRAEEGFLAAPVALAPSVIPMGAQGENRL